jgi:hypothetical protein
LASPWGILATCCYPAYLYVRDGEGGAGDSGLGQVLVVNNDLADLSVAERDTLAIRGGRDISELDSGGEGGKRYRLAVVTVALLEILDDKFGARLAEAAGGLVGELLGHLLASRQVLQRSRTAGQGGGFDRHLN